MIDSPKHNRIYYCILGFITELEAKHLDADRELDPDEILTLFNLSNVGFTISREQFKEALNRAAQNGLVEWIEDDEE